MSKADFETFSDGLLDYQPPALTIEKQDGSYAPFSLSVTMPDGRSLPVLIQLPLPRAYDHQRLWPLLLAMHGGPGRGPDDGRLGALRMQNAWRAAANDAGWVVASPAMNHVYVHGRASAQRLAYEILTSKQMEAVVADVTRHFRIDPNLVVATGVSLGANFSIAHAVARPDRFSSIVPISSEGEFRQKLLRNLRHTCVFIVSGGRDRNIRTIDGPRAMFRILSGFNFNVVYREFAERGHEAFVPLYPEILNWTVKRPRDPFPAVVLRIPHQGIMPVARRIHWLEVDTRQGLAGGEIKPGNRIVLNVRWARIMTLFLHGRLVDLDKPITVELNGITVFTGKLSRSLRTALQQVRVLQDRGRPYAASFRLNVPDSANSREVARHWSDSLLESSVSGPLSYWEYFAAQTLSERFPRPGFDGSPRARDEEFVGIEVTQVQSDGAFSQAGLEVGDYLLEVDGEPFLPHKDLSDLEFWLERELTESPARYPLVILRDGRRVTLESMLGLEQF